MDSSAAAVRRAPCARMAGERISQGGSRDLRKISEASLLAEKIRCGPRVHSELVSPSDGLVGWNDLGTGVRPESSGNSVGNLWTSSPEDSRPRCQASPRSVRSLVGRKSKALGPRVDGASRRPKRCRYSFLRRAAAICARPSEDVAVQRLASPYFLRAALAQEPGSISRIRHGPAYRAGSSRAESSRAARFVGLVIGFGNRSPAPTGLPASREVAPDSRTARRLRRDGISIRSDEAKYGRSVESHSERGSRRDDPNASAGQDFGVGPYPPGQGLARPRSRGRTSSHQGSMITSAGSISRA